MSGIFRPVRRCRGSHCFRNASFVPGYTCVANRMCWSNQLIVYRGRRAHFLVSLGKGASVAIAQFSRNIDFFLTQFIPRHSQNNSHGPSGFNLLGSGVHTFQRQCPESTISCNNVSNKCSIRFFIDACALRFYGPIYNFRFSVGAQGGCAGNVYVGSSHCRMLLVPEETYFCWGRSEPMINST